MTAVPDSLTTPRLAAGEPAAASWVTVCPLHRLQPELAVAALVHGAHVAVVRTADGTVHAVGNRDPFSGASLLSRGIVGSRGGDPGVPTLTSPLHKQVFELPTGRCVDDPTVSLPVHPVRIWGGMVQVASTPLRLES
jgi:nitrite reductase (NADH) small subunit